MNASPLTRHLVFLFALCAATALHGQMPHTTTLVMGLDVGNGIAPPAPPSRVRIPPGERVVLQVQPPAGTSVQWTKDGNPIAGATSAMLLLVQASTSDSGTYGLTGLKWPVVATGISLDVVPEGHLGNLSARVELAPGRSVQLVGFVIGGTTRKPFLYRAVGPTLRGMGVASPAARPHVQLFDARGQPVFFVHPAMVFDLNVLFQSVGAFPVTTDELKTISFDWGSLEPGSYTLQVSDDAGAGGTALVELYEMAAPVFQSGS